MKCSKLRISIYVMISLMLFFAPIALGIDAGSEAHAMGFLGKKSGNDRSSHGRIISAHPDNKGEQPLGGNNPTPSPTPEPATWLLVGAGAAGMAAFKKKFKKK